MTQLTSEAVLKALSEVQEPELHRDLVTLNMIQDVEINNGMVAFTIVLTTPACPLRTQIEAEARAAVAALPGVERVQIKLSGQVPSSGKIQSQLLLPIRNAVAVASGKGGVGKSTVAVNLAVALAASGAEVGLLDADIYGPNIPTLMGVERLPSPQNERLLPAQAYGVKLMSIGFMVKPGQALIWRGPMLHTAIRQFLTDVEWGELDYLIVDLPPGTGDTQLSLAQLIPLSGGLIVTLPQKISLEDASRGLQMFREVNVPVLGVVENMSYLSLPDGARMEVFGSGGGEKLAQAAGVPYLGGIPLDPAVRIGGDEGVPIVVSAPDSQAGKALRAVAEQLAARISVTAYQTEGVP